MADEQKANVQPFPECIPPPSPNAPKVKKEEKSDIPPPPPTKSSKKNQSISKQKNDSIIYYSRDKLITEEEANELEKKNKILSVNIIKLDDGRSKVIITEKPTLDKKAPSAENGNLYTPAQAPPPPNTNMVEYVKELAKRGTTFYIGPHKYSAEEALKMVQKSTNEVTIDVSKYPDVHLGGC